MLIRLLYTKYWLLWLMCRQDECAILSACCPDIVPVACPWTVDFFFLAGFWSDRISYRAYQTAVLLDMNWRYTLTAWKCVTMLQGVVSGVFVGAVIGFMCKMIAHGC